MNKVYIALGSNLENPLQQVKTACDSISQLGKITAQSHWYESEPVGPGKQAKYINGVICLETELEPLALLDQLQAIELKQGRVRQEKWGPRTIDLDILLFNQLTITTDRLVIPHPHMLERSFVLWPLHDIAPELVLPDGSNLVSCLKKLEPKGLVKLDEKR